MKVAIVGSRDFAVETKRHSPSYAKHVFIEYLVSQLDSTDYVVTGGANGADLWAEFFAKRQRVGRIVHEADWDSHGRSAGPRRNALVVKDADIMFAFYTDKTTSRGTANAVSQARKKGIPVYEYDASEEESPSWQFELANIFDEMAGLSRKSG
jgi:hypothetical protein